MTSTDQLTIRFSRPQDARAVARLAELDSARCPQGRLLLAEVAGELRAAVAVDGDAAIADPFRPTSDLVDLLHARRRQVLGDERPRRRRRLAPFVRVSSAKA